MSFKKRVQLIAFILVFGLSAHAFCKEVDAGLRATRLSHAKELLGSGFKSKVVRKHESDQDLEKFVMESTRQFLPKAYRGNAGKISETILEAAAEYEFDPIFLMAVIQNESSFNPKRKGGVGEIGLMQILPSTAAWISKTYDLEYRGEKSLFQPEVNIWIGAALLHKLRVQFDSASRLYLSAYNVGPKKLRKLMSENKRPKEYVQAVMKRYMAIYKGFKASGDSVQQGKIAIQTTMNLTRKLAKN